MIHGKTTLIPPLPGASDLSATSDVEAAMMRLVLANAILGTALAWAVLHDRAPAPDEPGLAQAAAMTPAAAPAVAPAMLPIVPISVAAEPEAPVAAAESEPVPTEASVATIEAEPQGGPAGALPEVSRAGRLAALDALAAEMERFALDRRR
jgi:hypothetical protein